MGSRLLIADLTHKLSKLGFVNAIIILHKDIVSNRFDPAFVEVLSMLQTMFRQSGKNFWDHVILCYTRCNTCEKAWKMGIDQKKAAMQNAIREQFGCNQDVPIVTVGGLDAVNGCTDTSVETDRHWVQFPSEIRRSYLYMLPRGS